MKISWRVSAAHLTLLLALMLPRSLFGVPIEIRLPAEGEPAQQWMLVRSEDGLIVLEADVERLGSVMKLTATAPELPESWLESAAIILKDGQMLSTPFTRASSSSAHYSREIEDLDFEIRRVRQNIEDINNEVASARSAPPSDTASSLEAVRQRIAEVESKIALLQARKSAK